MDYISYFDLLGTRGFCDNPHTYYENISAFKKAIKETAWLLKDYGKVGVFSDSAYAESSDLKYLLDFLVELRDRLISENLFFNAVVKKGKLGVEPMDSKDGNVAFGVAFTQSDIAELYIAQTNFKGIGIFIDKSIQDEVSSTGYRLNDCIYVRHNSDHTGYSPVKYKDISFNASIHEKKSIERLLKTVIRNMYSSYMKSPRFGVYYISILSNLIRSYTDTFDWDLSKRCFTSVPLAFDLINRMIRDHFSDLSDLHGIEYLAFILLDVIYNSDNLHEAQKNDITLTFTKYDCIKSKYAHSLNQIPSELFSFNSDSQASNRELFITYCQDEMSNHFVDDILG